METKSLLYGLGGFFLGGLIVSIAATTLSTSGQADDDSSMSSSMQTSTDALKGKTGDDFDAAFLSDMIAHHKGAVAMAQIAEKNAKHDEIMALSRDIMAAQKREIVDMQRWQGEWGYDTDTTIHRDGDH